MNALQQIQLELKAPKSKRNTFGNYNYRNCEDILEAVKPLLQKFNSSLVLSDEVQEIGPVVVVTAKAIFTDADGKQTVVTAHAGVEVNKKGMDVAQTFGASSSYARKYALNGLFLIDDTKDYDSDEYHQQINHQASKQQNRSAPQKQQQAQPQPNRQQQPQQQSGEPTPAAFQDALQQIQHAQHENELAAIYKSFKGTRYEQLIIKSCKAKKDMEGWSA
ncbi:ERF family protein [Acinetobacter radioresistens]|uniref:ERF family protein n=1 Tax=Acinetobacter radioresistens TaxID=40216 RepID=UPI000E7144D8|nr:ERF family protein [Acinetobacter radioresistens]RJL73007.1 Essential recombination function protein [Acinetobacter radioresistens]